MNLIHYGENDCLLYVYFYHVDGHSFFQYMGGQKKHKGEIKYNKTCL